TDEALTFDEVLNYFHVSDLDAKDFFRAYREKQSLDSSIFHHVQSSQRLVPFALKGLGDFMHAGLQLKAIVEDEVLWPLRPESFAFIKEMISEGHKAQLREWMFERNLSRKKISIASTLLWHLGEVPKIQSNGGYYFFLEAVLPGIPWENVKLPGVHFLSCKLTGAHFRGANLSGGLICGTSLQSADFEGSDLERARFAECSLQQSRFPGSDLVESDFSRCSLDRANFLGARLDHSTFNSCSVAGTHFTNCCFSAVRLKLIDLRNCIFSDSHFDSAKIEECNLSFVDLSEFNGQRSVFTKCELSNTSFSGGRLNWAQFVHCRANEINFEGANLKNSIFNGVNFHAGSSRCGILSDKPALEGNMTQYYAENQVEDAWVSPESVRHANFAGADLRGAKFINTNLFRVDFRGALLDKDLEITARKHKAILDEH
ncbi:MAG: pentapeptide repeat-containing protein, partial [Planctomycetota bacterium]|nr:pentapeptide repeat-containing protein [Planctomycetota bacterium]